MGLFDKAVKAAKGMSGKADDVAREHGGKIRHGIDKAAGLADRKSGGRYRDRIGRVSEKAKHAVDDLAARDQRQ